MLDAVPRADAAVPHAPAGPGSALFLMSHSAAGGILELWTNLADGLAARGHRTAVAALYPDAFTAGGAEARCRHVLPRRPDSLLARARVLSDLARWLRGQRPAAVFTAMPLANALVPLAARLADPRIRVMVSHHTPVDTYGRGLAALGAWTGRLPGVARVISVSDAVGRSLDGYPDAYRAKRVTIRNALPPEIERLCADLRAARPAARTEPPLVVATGRLSAQKNYPVLLRAAARLPGVRFEILGTGPDEADLRGLADDLGVSARVTFRGQLPRAAALERLARADVFAQPSLYEGHSLGLVEAAHLHLPLVVSDVPVQVEGVTAADGRLCGARVDPHDDAGLARAIGGLLEEPAAGEARAAAAHLAASARYAAMLDRYEALL